MKNKVVISVVLFFCVIFFTLAAAMFFVTADGNKYTLSGNIENEYSLGENFSIPKCSVNISGQHYDMEYEVYYPDGRVSQYSDMKLDAIGEYVVKYYYEKDGNSYYKSFSFNVDINNFTELFTCGDGVTIESNVNVNSWADKDLNGVNAQFVGGGTLKYNHVINLSDSDKYDYFIEYIANVAIDGQYEIDYITFTLTDIYNEDNYITILATNARMGGPYHYQRMTASACGLYDNIGFNTTHNTVNNFGAALRSSLYGNINGTYNTNTARLSYVSSEKQVWVRAFPEYSPYFCMDFDNEEYVDKKHVFNGFTSDLVYLTVNVVNSPLSPVSNLLITSLGGNLLSGEEIVSQNICFDIDTKGYNENALPLASVGKAYPVFNCFAFDNFGKKINNISTTVFDKNGIAVPIVNNYFYPEVCGEYFIKYEVKTDKLYDYKIIKITAVDEYSEPTFYFSQHQKNNVQVGERVEILDGIVTGGVGDTYTTVECLFDGQKIEIQQSLTGSYFIPTKVGCYEIVATLTDWTNNNNEFKFEINCDETVCPIMEKPYVSLVNIIGEKVVLPRVDAFASVNGELTLIPVKVFYDDQDISKFMTYTPTIAGEHTVKYVAVNPYDSSKITEHVFNVQVNGLVEQRRNGQTIEVDYLCGANGERKKAYDYIDSFLYLNGFENIFVNNVNDVSKSSYQLWADGSKSSAEMAFARPISVDDLSLAFATLPEYSNFYSYVITFVDSMNSSQKVEFSINRTEINGKSVTAVFMYGELCSTLEVDISGVNENLQFEIEYDDVNGTIVDSSTKKTIAVIRNYVNGEKFTGFLSGKAYLSLKCEGISAETRIKISQISSQLFMGRYIDRIAPSIKYYDDFKLSCNIYLGEKYQIQSVKLFDVCSDVSLDIKISTLTGDIIYQKAYIEGDSIVFDKIGSYLIEYKATDKSGNEAFQISTINVVAFEAPLISISGKIKNVKLGSSIELPKAQYDLNNSLYVYVVLPSGVSKIVTPNEDGKYMFRFDNKGINFVRYVVYDSSFNYTVYEVEVNVQ